MKAYLQKLEQSIDTKVAVWLLLTGLTVFLIGLVPYGIWGSRHDALDYGSVVFPCGAAIIAGLASFPDFSNWKGLIYFGSILLLMVGACCFISNHAQHVIVYTISILLVIMVMAVTLIYVFKKGKGFLSFAYGAHDTLIVILVVLLAVYAGFFFVKNVDCLKDPSTFSECKKFWFWGLW